ncbi:MAG: amidohydrolase family protein [Clostridia bacterium]|nr:amidohydrolase family protein [Clostridia bacterium]
MLDTVICGGRVLNGTEEPEKEIDVGLKDGKIAALGDLRAAEAQERIQARGRVVCPGFLDLHRHADGAVFRRGYGDGDLFQGITTVINGNCGLSLAPQLPPYQKDLAAYLEPVTGPYEGVPVESLGAYQEALSKVPLAVNAGMLAGGGALRGSVCGFSKTQLEKADIRAIQRLLEQTLFQGALGVSLGLGYAPECFYSTEELIEVLAPIAHSKTVLSVHMRSEAMHLLPSIEEMLTVARALDVPLQLSHLKGTGRENWGKTVPLALARIAAAREQGLDVCCDAYPYTFGSTQLVHILPPECLKGGMAALTQRLGEGGERQRIKARLRDGRDFDNYVHLIGWENIYPTSLVCPEDEVYIGKSLLEGAQGGDPADFAFDLLRRNRCRVTMMDTLTVPEDIAAIYQTPFAYVISDATFPATGRLHPRVCGAFAAILETFVNQRHDLTLPEAIHRMTRRPADRYGLTHKGRIELGADADVLVFAPENIHVNATVSNPTALSSGMDYVFVNGKAAVYEGRRQDIFAGKVLLG